MAAETTKYLQTKKIIKNKHIGIAEIAGRLFVHKRLFCYLINWIWLGSRSKQKKPKG